MLAIRDPASGLSTTGLNRRPTCAAHAWTHAPRAAVAKETLASDVLALLDALEWGGWAFEHDRDAAGCSDCASRSACGRLHDPGAGHTDAADLLSLLAACVHASRSAGPAAGPSARRPALMRAGARGDAVSRRRTLDASSRSPSAQSRPGFTHSRLDALPTARSSSASERTIARGCATAPGSSRTPERMPLGESTR